MAPESSTGRTPQDSNRSPVQRYQFIAVSGAERRTNAETLRLVHSHAQTNYLRRNPRRRRQTTWEVDVSPLLSNSAQSETVTSDAVVTSPVTMLSASRSDPFATFGIEAGSRAHRLWAHGGLVLERMDWRI